MQIRASVHIVASRLEARLFSRERAQTQTQTQARMQTQAYVQSDVTQGAKMHVSNQQEETSASSAKSSTHSVAPKAKKLGVLFCIFGPLGCVSLFLALFELYYIFAVVTTTRFCSDPPLLLAASLMLATAALMFSGLKELSDLRATQKEKFAKKQHLLLGIALIVLAMALLLIFSYSHLLIIAERQMRLWLSSADETITILYTALLVASIANGLFFIVAACARKKKGQPGASQMLIGILVLTSALFITIRLLKGGYLPPLNIEASVIAAHLLEGKDSYLFSILATMPFPIAIAILGTSFVLKRPYILPASAIQREDATLYRTRTVPGDARSKGYAVLASFFPLVGLALFLIWKDQLPLKAKSCGKGALIGVITYVGLLIFFIALSLLAISAVWH